MNRSLALFLIVGYGSFVAGYLCAISMPLEFIERRRRK